MFQKTLFLHVEALQPAPWRLVWGLREEREPTMDLGAATELPHSSWLGPTVPREWRTPEAIPALLSQREAS